jgi:hypothetical protein
VIVVTNPDDDPHGEIVANNPLKDKHDDDGDGDDEPLPTLIGRGVDRRGATNEERTCHQCDGPLDGTERVYVIDEQPRWLHPECAGYLSRQKEQVP